MFVRSLLSVVVLSLITVLAVRAETHSSDTQFEAIWQADWAFRLAEYPELASRMGEPDRNDELTDYSDEARERRYQHWQATLARLDALDETALSREQQVNFRILRDQLVNSIADHETGAAMMPLNSDSGFHSALAFLPNYQPLNNEQDYRDYIQRLREIPRVFAQQTALMRRGLETGMTVPAVVLQGRDGSIAAHAKLEDPRDSVFYAPFKQLPESFSAASRDALQAEALKAINEAVVPAYAGFLNFMRDEYMPGARSSLAATELPNGERYYQAQIRRYTTLDLSAEQIHQIGVDEVARIRAEMQAIIEEVGFDGSFAEFIEFLRTDDQFYANSPEQLMMVARDIAKRADGALPRFFSTLPRQPYAVNPVPADIAPTYTAGRYVGAPIDSPRPGQYWVNTYDLPSRPLYALPALTLHEAVPGHHLQNALAAELGEQPPFRRYSYISAFGEGWALYTEHLGVEMGIYRTPYEHFGRLTYEMWRAARLVIDTGVHAKGWSRDQAVDFLASNTALSMHEVNTEIDRYISWPAQALSYKLGEIRIRELRKQAEQTLFEAFDIRAFHDTVLALGSVPLDVMTEHVQQWISEQQAASDRA
jgi:uncharacterized protein (DUF885 family)